MSTSSPDDVPETDTESHDSILVEFEFDCSNLVSPDPALIEAAVRHAPAWLREGATGRPPGANLDLAECLLEQAVLLNNLKRYADAAPRAAEAAGLFERAGRFARVADCFRVSAVICRATGDIDKAIEYLGKEEELRRRLAA